MIRNASEVVVINVCRGRAVVSHYVTHEDGSFSVVPALNWAKLEKTAARDVIEHGGTLNQIAIYICPISLMNAAIWDESEMLSVTEAVILSQEITSSNIPLRTIRYAAKSGGISGAVKDGRDWRIPRLSLLNWLSHRPKRGRKRPVLK